MKKRNATTSKLTRKRKFCHIRKKEFDDEFHDEENS